MAYRIVLADDHALLRAGLRKIIEGRPGFVVAGETGDGLDLLRLVRDLQPDMVVLDISMPGLRGIEACSEIRAMRRDVRLLIVTMHKERGYLLQAFQAGTDGYLLKDDADQELFAAISAVRNGGTFVSPLLAEVISADLIAACRRGREPFDDPLTVREREVIKLIAEGRSSREIAGLLFISPRTVDHHRASIMGKLGVRKATDLVRCAAERGYL